jgi:hypothetical protein
MKLEPDFEDKIQEFKILCEELPISITQKLHILFHHVQEFVKAVNNSLGLYSEQTSELVHHDFGILWSQQYKQEIIHPTNSC